MSHVAEVWLEWPVCRGSTMYRAQARTHLDAVLKAQQAAVQLDQLLPRSYMDTDWRGRPCRMPYDYGIQFGVRELTDREKTEGVAALWTTVLPGSPAFAGEHASAHPRTDPSNQPVAAGVKL